MNPKLKFLAAFFIIAGWYALVFLGKTPVVDFIETLKLILLSLGVYHATLTDPKA